MRDAIGGNGIDQDLLLQCHKLINGNNNEPEFIAVAMHWNPLPKMYKYLDSQFDLSLVLGLAFFLVLVYENSVDSTSLEFRTRPAESSQTGERNERTNLETRGSPSALLMPTSRGMHSGYIIALSPAVYGTGGVRMRKGTRPYLLYHFLANLMICSNRSPKKEAEGKISILVPYALV